MPVDPARQRVFRFAPSPNGYLHIGHAYSAILNHNLALECGGRFLLRIEDIDLGRFRQAFLDQIFDDLSWLGLDWEEPVRRQSGHFEDYRSALGRLAAKLPLYKAGMSRREIRDFVDAHDRKAGAPWRRDPDGAPLYPALDRPEHFLSAHEVAGISETIIRIEMDRSVASLPQPLTWVETGRGPGGETGRVVADPSAWGDVVVARRDCPTSYALSVVVDDALQGVTDVVRGQDLFHATSVQRLLQHFLSLSEPVYHHHALVLDEAGHKLSKSLGSPSIRALRQDGVARDRVLDLIGLRPH